MFYLTLTKNMFAGKFVKLVRILAVLREYVFHNAEWLDIRKISGAFLN